MEKGSNSGWRSL